MTQPEESPPVLSNDASATSVADQQASSEAADAGVGVEEQAPPQPWTPERVSEWNAYYDMYVMLAVLLLAFVVSAVKLSSSSVWTHLKTGELIVQQAAPVATDSFSYTETGRRWVNIPWLFQAGHALLYKVVRDLVPSDPADPTANQASAEQIAIGGLIGLNALIRLITAWILLKIRHRGPGLWWSAVCVTLAVGATFGPSFIAYGGIAGPGQVAPPNWGLLLLAIEMLLLHRAFNQGRGGALYALVPLFVIWANLDESFFPGLLILAAAVIGRLLDGKSAEALLQADAADPAKPRGAVRPVTGALVLVLCLAATLINPSTFRVYSAVVTPMLGIFGQETDVYTLGELSYFGKTIQKLQADWYWYTLYYLVVVALGLGSFLLNAGRFAWSRFLPFAVMAGLWGCFIGFGTEFAVVFAAVLSLNGQEWYHDRFGVEGRLGAGWSVFSTGGRLVTLAALFACISLAITGYLKSAGDPQFGFSFDPNEFPFEFAEYLARRDDIKGNVLNTTASQGDALIWKAYPARRTFLDGRAHLFSRELLEEHHGLRNAIRDDDTAAWRPALDKYGITAVSIDSLDSPRTYRRLMQSTNWIPFYDDGRVVMFGRADAPEPDLAAFKNNRLEPDLRAYRVTQQVPSVDRPPTPTSWLDQYFRNRLLGRPQSHTNSAGRWLQPQTVSEDGQAGMPDPARCLLAIREARTALAKNPDDWVAYRLLDVAYRSLMLQETALLAGIPLSPENDARIAMLSPSVELLSTRFRQRVTAMNYAIQTSPPPRSPEARRELAALNLELFQLFLQAGFADLARDRLQVVMEQSQPGDFTPEAKAQYDQQLEQLNQRVKQVEDALLDLQVERQAGPIEKAMYARGQGAPGLAIGELEEAERGNMSPVLVRPQLVDIYCSTGQPDRALELLTMGANEDSSLGQEPGSSFFRQGQVYLLLGNYLSAASLWRERAIPRLRFERSMRALSLGQSMGRGDLVAVTNTNLSLPPLVSRQAYWEYELGQCLLESGAPDQAAEYFTRALTLVPDLPVRPIIAYYLEKMGKPVPELPKKAGAEPSAPKNPVDRLLRQPLPGALPTGPQRPATTPPPTDAGKVSSGAAPATKPTEAKKP